MELKTNLARPPISLTATGSALVLPDKTRDVCREFDSEAILASYNELDVSIREKGRMIAGNLGKLLPELARMQALLSQRGGNKKERDQFGGLNLPTWTEYFESFRQEVHLDASLRTIQRALSAMAEGNKQQHCRKKRQGMPYVRPQNPIVTLAVKASSIVSNQLRDRLIGTTEGKQLVQIATRILELSRKRSRNRSTPNPAQMPEANCEFHIQEENVNAA